MEEEVRLRDAPYLEEEVRLRDAPYLFA